MQSTTGMIRTKGPFGMTSKPLTVTQIVRDNYRIKSFVFDGQMPDAKPGQFVMAWLPRLDEKPFSLVNHLPLSLTIAAVGKFSESMHSLKIGDQVWFRGPFGRQFEAVGQRPVLVAGGYRVGALAWLARQQLAAGQQPIAVIGGRTSQDIIGVDKFKELGVPVLITTNDGSQGEKGLATAAVKRLLTEGAIDSICALGPHGMLQALEELAQAHQVPAQLSWEAYMGCAIGLCGMCEHDDGSLLCIEGPIRRL